jgi:hypothetical protein
MSRPKILQDRSVELTLAVALFVASAWLVHDAYEARGAKRPFATKLLPIP